MIDQHLKAVGDSAIGLAAVTSPYWVAMLDTAAGKFTLYGGALLVAIRLFLTIREWLRK